MTLSHAARAPTPSAAHRPAPTRSSGPSLPSTRSTATRRPFTSSFRAAGLLVSAGLALGGCASGGATPDAGGDTGPTPGAVPADSAAGAPPPSPDAGPDSGAATPAEDSAAVAPGLGTLRQDDITLSLRSGDLLVKITPMAEDIIRLTAPDTYQRLGALAGAHRGMARDRTGFRDPTLFLISAYSAAPNTPFDPEALSVVSHGRRHRPAAIQAVTSGWGTRMLEQQETRVAVYVFDPDIDLESSLIVEYLGARNDRWSRILPVIRAERAKVRSRGGGAD